MQKRVAYYMTSKTVSEQNQQNILQEKQSLTVCLQIPTNLEDLL